MKIKTAIVLLLAIITKLEAKEFPKWRLYRRTSSIRDALANKVDPNFWPSRGRRSALARQTTTEEAGPFWGNRGRNLDDQIDPSLLKILFGNEIHSKATTTRQQSEVDPFFANRGRYAGDGSTQTAQDDSFWANRGRTVDQTDTGPFWASHGRSASTAKREHPFWVRNDEINDEFWANRGRSPETAEKEEGVLTSRPLAEAVQAFRTIKEERVRPVDSQSKVYRPISRDMIKSFSNRLSRSLLSAEEPGFVAWPRRSTKDSSDETFWVSRGKKSKRGEQAILANRGLDHIKSTFWPSRGKKASPTV